MKKIGISIGWNCGSATFGVSTGLRLQKKDGYKTCPFDIMTTNYDGLVQCIKDDFKHLCDEKYLILQPPINHTETPHKVIYNTLYNFEFTHESPGIADLYLTENWSGGINHFVDNNYSELKQRYARRIQNFRNYMSNPLCHITFILTTWNKTQNDIKEFKEAIESRYPRLKYKVLIKNEPRGEEYYIKHMLYLKCS